MSFPPRDLTGFLWERMEMRENDSIYKALSSSFWRLGGGDVMKYDSLRSQEMKK